MFALLAALTALALFAGATVPRADAAAKPRKADRVAYFNAKLEATQEIGWLYQRDLDVSNECLGWQLADGKTVLDYRSPGSGEKIVAMEVSKRSPLWSQTRGRPYVGALDGAFETDAAIYMEGESETGGVDPIKCPGADGGGKQPTECSSGLGDDIRWDFFTTGTAKRYSLGLEGFQRGMWRGNQAPSGSLSTAFRNCPHWVGGGPAPDYSAIADGSFDPGADHLASRKGLFDPKRKRIVLTFEDYVCFDHDGVVPCEESNQPNPEDGSFFDGTLESEYRLTLTRTRR
ncbi:hypothetical protein HJD18_05410 [Thermoleophilia bacterium SCSIO 60948]|nr:hypothetical protein HJD18_05410 [Thermoleophilia bacterium SCSIO 60948]